MSDGDEGEEPTRKISALVLSIIVLSILGAVQPSYGGYTVKPGLDGLQVQITSHVHQNVTEFTVSHIRLEGENASTATAMFEDAIKQKTPGAHVQDVKLQVDANATEFETRASFNITGIMTTSSGRDTFDLGWRSFALAGEPVAGVVVNEVGQKLLFNTVDSLLIPATAQSNSRAFINDQGPVRFDLVREKTRNISLLNFTDFSAPLQNWKADYSLSTDLSRWTKSFETRIRIIVTEVEPEPIPTDYEVSYANSAEIEIRGFASAGQDRILVGESSLALGAMLTVIIGSAGLFLATFFTERRLTRSVKRRRR